jgi:hypothetical protein
MPGGKSPNPWWQANLRKQEGRSDMPMKPQVVAAELGRRLAATTIISCDSGTSTTWWARHIPAKRGQMFSCSGNLASMAGGLPYTIAAQIAYPERQCVAFVGDGGFSMLMAEFASRRDSRNGSLAPQAGLELTALRLTGNRVMVRSTIPTKSSRPLSPVALPAPAPSVNLVTPELLTAPADALHHHDEQDLAFVPSADPAHPPTIDAIPQYGRLGEAEESGLDWRLRHQVRRGRRSWFRWQHGGLASDVHGISVGTHVNHHSGTLRRHRRGAGDFSRGEHNDLFSHVMTPYLV